MTVDIHAHPDYKIGVKPPLPEAVAPRVKLAQILRPGVTVADVMPHPATVDHFSKVGGQWQMGANDQFGTCGPTSMANGRLVTVSYIPMANSLAPSLNDIFDLYRSCQGNEKFDPNNYRDADDNGVIMQEMLNNARKLGFGKDKDGNPLKPVAFAQVDITNDDELEIAMAIFGHILCGWDLQEAQQGQTDRGGPWDYVAGSRPWGGHATMEAFYANDNQENITWTREIGTTDSFRRHQLSEAWVVVWPENMQTEQYEAGVSTAALAAIFKNLTGETLPVPAPPSPPQPQPGSGGSPDISFLDSDVQAHIQRAAKRAKMDLGAWLNRHFRKYFD